MCCEGERHECLPRRHAGSHHAVSDARKAGGALPPAHPAKFPDAAEAATGVRPPLPEHLADLFVEAGQIPEEIDVTAEFDNRFNELVEQEAGE